MAAIRNSNFTYMFFIQKAEQFNSVNEEKKSE